MLAVLEESLKELVQQTPGAQAALIMDGAGIALATHTRVPNRGERPPAFDVATIGIEFTVVVSSVKRAAEMLEAGAAREVSVVSDKLVTLIRMIGSEYFLALQVTPEGNLGKGRYLLRMLEPKLLAQLSSA